MIGLFRRDITYLLGVIFIYLNTFNLFVSNKIAYQAYIYYSMVGLLYKLLTDGSNQYM